jgi:hypothetical protein
VKKSRRCLHNPSGPRALGFGKASGPVGPGRVAVCVSHQPAAEWCRKASILQNNYTKPSTTGLRAADLLRAGRFADHILFFYRLSQLVRRHLRLAPYLRQSTVFVALHFDLRSISAARGNRFHIDTNGQQCYGWHGVCHQMCPQGVPTVQSEGIMKYIKRLMCVPPDPFVHKACRWAHVLLLTDQHRQI